MPLSARACEALDAVCPSKGLVFGKHDYRAQLEKAARSVLSSDRADAFCGAHLRSARITHWTEDPKASLAAAQYLAGHKRTETTARCIKPTLRAARDMLH